MATMKEAVDDFLAQQRIAVTGVSRSGSQPANSIFNKLRDAGIQVFPTNPLTDEVEGVPCYPNLKAIPGGVDAVMIATPPAAADGIVRECAELGIKRVWMHQSIDGGSYSASAEAFCKENGITVIPAGCPMMYCDPVDFGHKCMRWIFNLTGRLPKTVD